MHIFREKALKPLKTLAFVTVKNVQKFCKLFLRVFLEKFYIKIHILHISRDNSGERFMFFLTSPSGLL